MAPEIRAITGDRGRYDCRVDLYSFGVMMLYLAGNFLAFDRSQPLPAAGNTHVVCRHKKRGEEFLSKRCPKLAELLQNCCAERPDDRMPSATEALRQLAAISLETDVFDLPGYDGGDDLPVHVGFQVCLFECPVTDQTVVFGEIALSLRDCIVFS
jgi:serine/threonine protein kinase